jgi:hypothetical protein
MNRTCTIKSMAQYISKVNSITLKSEIPMYPPKLLFRGLSKSKYELTPSLDRCPSPTWMNSLQMVEKDLVQTTQQKFPLIFPDTDYPVIRLAKLQHYGIPTRMMDVTENALVALYFACLGNQDSDGEVIAFSGNMCSAFNPVANIIADTYRLTGNSIIDTKNYRYRALSQPYSVGLVDSSWKDCNPKKLANFIKIISKPIFVEAGTVCERQKNQSGKFILFPSRINPQNGYVLDELQKLEKSNKCIVKRIKIPAECKAIFLTQLKRLGVSEDFLFADDVDKVCHYIVEEQKARYNEELE